MFVVIQEIQLKKPNTYGAYREYEVTSTSFSISGNSITRYSYYPAYDKGRFERPHMEAYKISIHESRRENGAVKKKQCVIGTIGYYALADKFGLFDYMEKGLKRAAEVFDSDFNTLYDLTAAKLNPLAEQIQQEFKKTEEYKAIYQREKVKKEYIKAKAAFAQKYHVTENEYDACYNIFGEVMNQAYLDEIIRNAKEYSSYYDNKSGNYNNGGYDYSSYFKANCSNYTDDEKAILKKFYKALSVKFHPDMNPQADTTTEMQFLNKLKQEWSI